MDKLNIFSKAYCQEGGGFLKRANETHLREIFNKYASVDKNGEKFMTAEDFVIKYLNILDQNNYNADTLRLLAAIVDTSKDGLISYPEFQAFEGLLCFPDALYKTAFQLFDTNGNGMVSFQEFLEVMQKTDLHRKIPFNMESPFVQLYFGKEKNRLVTYNEFSQFLHDFHEEYAIEGFRRADKNGTGFISILDFQEIMVSIKSHLLTKQVQSHLIEAAQQQSQGASRISFPYFIAFNSLLNNMELAKRIYLNVTNGHRTQEVSKEEFMHSAQAMSQMTPLEVDILFHLSDVLHQSGRIVYNDLSAIAPEQYFKQITNRLAEIHAVSSPEDRGVVIQILESTYRFSLGSIAGAVGATAVYPIDLVKTRMQNQRTGSFIGELMYRNSFDCFKKVIRHEGVFGLYRGLVPQLLGVAPEKAIKLTMNDLVRDKLMDKNGNIPIYGEVIAGCCAGGSQVIFTNPLEIVKIRLQVAGEIAGGAKVRAWNVVKDLGFLGLYKGSRACFLRDIPFSGIYFPVYAHTKAKFADENGYNSPITLLGAGIVAGIPAAALCTPADVIKTRLQVVARAGQTTYSGLLDAARKIYMEEGFSALWKGTTARVLRSSPQFGVTLVTYELLQRYLYVDFGGTRPTGSELKQVSTMGDVKPQNADHIGGYSVSLPIFSGIETKFGLCLPKYSVQQKS
ncbi:calcium-binding mitochondrial carrier protein aralar1 isoform X1 [Leptinotarsa decemlineata]|uniref:calcium-binding mitochondrial carrier protein aralar1 isoform X1 n=2 Tax=Leptinotarsa decemlineata TaxID=7539 RepID=UPI003D309441